MSTPGKQLGPERGAMSAVLSESFQGGGHVSVPEIISRRGYDVSADDEEDDARKRVSDDADLSTLIRPCLTEFFATALFVIIGLLSVLNFLGADNVLGVALAHGLALAGIASATASVSGGHVNPAVTLGVFLNGQLGFVRLVVYWFAQLLGAASGSAIVLGLVGQDDMEKIGYGAHHPLTGYTENGTDVQLVSNGSAVGLELFATLLFVLVVLRAGSGEHGPLYVGLALTTAILAIGKLTGGSMNPARSFGPALVSVNAIGQGKFTDQTLYLDTFWKEHWIYWVGPMAGSVLASITSRYLLTEQVGTTKHLYQCISKSDDG